MFLSIIIPVLNGEKYIEECIESCLHQDIPCDDYEIICIDDCSDDNTMSIVSELKRKANNLYVIEKDERTGVSESRNIGIANARGDYIWFVDADDYIEINVLSRLRNEAYLNNCDRLRLGSYVFTDTLSATEMSARLNGTLKPNVPIKNIYVTRCLYRRGHIIGNGIRFATGVAYGEDVLFDYDINLTDNLSIESPQVIYFYRRHNASVMQLTTETKKINKVNSHIWGLKYVYQHYQSEENKRIISVVYLLENLRTVMSAITTLQRDLAIEKCSEICMIGPFPRVCLSDEIGVGVMVLGNIYSLLYNILFHLTKKKHNYYILALLHRFYRRRSSKNIRKRIKQLLGKRLTTR